MADITFQGIASDANRTARVWQRPMRSATSHARIAIFEAESPILSKTIADDFSRIIDRDTLFPKMLEQVQAASVSISDNTISLLIGEAHGETLLFHAHGTIRCFLAEEQGDTWQITTLPVEPYTAGDPFTYVTGQVGNGIFIAYTEETELATTPEAIAAAASTEHGLWKLKQHLEKTNEDARFCIIVGKSERIPGSTPSVTADVAIIEASDDTVTVSEVITTTQPQTPQAPDEDLFAPPQAVADAIDTMQNWAKDTRAQFTESMKQASSYDPRSFFRKMGNAFAVGKMGAFGQQASVSGERSNPFKNFGRNALNRFMKLPRNLQIASAGLSFCILLFLVGIAVAPLFGYGRGNARMDQELIAISSLLDDAQSNLIYKNEDRAVSLVKEAYERLDRLNAEMPTIKNKDITRRRNELSMRLTTMRSDLRRTTVVNTTDNILVSEASGVTSLTAVGKDLFAARGTEIMRWNMSEGIFDTVASTNAAGVSILPDEVDDLIIQRSTESALTVINPKTKKTEAGPKADKTYSAIAAYGGRYYGVDPTRGIVRLSDAGAQSWQKSPSPMSDARGIAVDGDVYVALPNEIKKFRTGNAVSFAVNPIDPSLTDIKGLYTTADSSSLYILDQGGARLLVVNKNGKLTRQYEIGQGMSASAFAVSEANKSAYMLVGSTIIKIPLSHL